MVEEGTIENCAGLLLRDLFTVVLGWVFKVLFSENLMNLPSGPIYLFFLISLKMLLPLLSIRRGVPDR